MGIKLYNTRRDLDLNLIERETTQLMYVSKKVCSLPSRDTNHCRLNINVDVFAIFNGNYTCKWIIMLEFVFRR